MADVDHLRQRRPRLSTAETIPRRLLLPEELRFLKRAL